MVADRWTRQVRTGGAALIALVLVGCPGRVDPRLIPTDPHPFPVSLETMPPAAPVDDAPPGAVVTTPTGETTVTGVDATTGTHISDAAEQQLVMRARLDRMVIGLAAGGTAPAPETLTGVATTKLTETGLRVRDLGTVTRYDAPSSDYSTAAGTDAFDLLIVLWGSARQADKFGNFYSYEARCKGKMIDPVDGSPVASREILRRGKRALSASDAERSSLEAGGEEVVKYLTDELVRKVEHNGYVMRLVLADVRTSEEVDTIRTYLQSRPGVAEARVVSWSKKGRRARLLVRMHPGTKANLAAYVETVPGIKMEVTDLSKRDVSGERKLDPRERKRRGR
ncbi:MAG: hypothetical protein ACYTKD_13065 [Planctomycetota bacterium]